MTVSRDPARSRDELSKSGCYKCGSAEHFHKDRHSGWVCPGKSTQSSSQKNSNSAAKAVPQPARSFADAVAQRAPSQDVATAVKIPLSAGSNSHSENCTLILQILQQVLGLLSAGSGCKCSSLATEEASKAVPDERLSLSAAHSIVSSLAALTVQMSVSDKQDTGAASVVVPKEAKAAAPLPKNNRSGPASPTNIVAPTSAKVPAWPKADTKLPSALAVAKETKSAASTPKNDPPGSASFTNLVAPTSNIPAAALIPKADSKITSSKDAKLRSPLSSDSNVAAAAAPAPVVVDSKAGTTASLSKIESKRSMADTSDKASQSRLSLSGDQSVTLAASASLSGVKSADTASVLSPRAMRRRRQQEHKGVASDEIIQDFRDTSRNRPVDVAHVKYDWFCARDVQIYKSRGKDLNGVLKEFDKKYEDPCCGRPYPWLNSTCSFYRELIAVAFNSNSVEQARARLVDFKARVAKLASLRSAD